VQYHRDDACFSSLCLECDPWPPPPALAQRIS
jgi:hypothetical protein